MRQHHNRDPYALTARYDGQCAKCQRAIKRGERAFYYPNTRTLYGMRQADGSGCECGDTAQSDFAAHAFDESVYGC